MPLCPHPVGHPRDRSSADDFTAGLLRGSSKTTLVQRPHTPALRGGRAHQFGRMNAVQNRPGSGENLSIYEDEENLPVSFFDGLSRHVDRGYPTHRSDFGNKKYARLFGSAALAVCALRSFASPSPQRTHIHPHQPATALRASSNRVPFPPPIVLLRTFGRRCPQTFAATQEG